MGQAILGLLKDACPRPLFEGAGFELYQGADFQKPLTLGISLFLYRVAPAASRRNLPARLLPDGRRRRPPLAVDLYYLLTAWGPSAEKQQQLLGWALRTLEDTPSLSAGVLNARQGTDAFFPDETVDIVLDTPTLQDLATLWDATKGSFQASAAYIVRQLVLDSEVPQHEGPPVQTRRIEAGREADR